MSDITNDQILQAVSEIFSDYLKFLSQQSVTAATFAKPNLERLHRILGEKLSPAEKKADA